MKMKVTFIAGVVGFVLAALPLGVAEASPHQLPFTYPYATMDKGETELELYNDLTPLRVNKVAADPTKGRLWEPAYTLQAELEYGVTDRWELAFYQVFESTPEDGGEQTMRFDGFKWRARTRLFEQGDLPVDVGLYFELETLHDEWALEEKILLEKQIGALRLQSNLWVEEELERPFDDGELAFIVNPTLGAAYQFTPIFSLGAEYWARGMLVPDGDDATTRRNNMVHHFFGPAVHVNFGNVWTAAGLYAHLNDVSKPQPGEAYGPVWFRFLLGITL